MCFCDCYPENAVYRYANGFFSLSDVSPQFNMELMSPGQPMLTGVTGGKQIYTSCISNSKPSNYDTQLSESYNGRMQVWNAWVPFWPAAGISVQYTVAGCMLTPSFSVFPHSLFIKSISLELKAMNIVSTMPSLQTKDF